MRPAAPLKISVLFPAYNEEASILQTMEKSLAALRSRFEEFEVLLIDDASRDGTYAIAEAFAARNPEVRVLRNASNVGQGATLVRGFREARYDLVIHNAIDYPFDLEDLDKMTPLLDEADIVVATRKGRPGYTLYRRFTSFVNIALLNLLFGLHLRDYNFVQLYRKSVLDHLRVEASSTAFLTPEILIRAHDSGFRIREVEIEYHPRKAGQATAGKPRVIIQSLRDMFRFWIRRRNAQRSANRDTGGNINL